MILTASAARTDPDKKRRNMDPRTNLIRIRLTSFGFLIITEGEPKIDKITSWDEREYAILAPSENALTTLEKVKT